MSGSLRTRFAGTHGDVVLLDAGDTAGLDRYLLDQHLATSAELPARVERAGEGNMNLSLRVALPGRTLILKQGRPWVEKYDHIAAPWERTLVEGHFYEADRNVPAVSRHLPALLALDAHNHVLVLEDLGTAGDLTTMYAGHRIAEGDLNELLAWLSALASVEVPDGSRAAFANRAMRLLNHEHIFSLPLAHRNGLDLDRTTRGLDRAASALKDDRAYATRVSDLGTAYLADGPSLVHGDYFPGSWVRSPHGIRIIDPEFSFLGAREFDYGVMLAHLALARVDVEPAARVVAASVRAHLDGRLMLGFAGVEIMRRLLGVAQLPLAYGLDVKRHLLDLSRSLVLTPERGVTACW
jgi:5-methylthioribose kinase